MGRSTAFTGMTLVLVLPIAAFAADTAPALKVTGIQAIHHDGQTFITWNDVLPDTPGAAYLYQVYRAAEPITADNLGKAMRTHKGVLSNSAKCEWMAWKPRLKHDHSGVSCIITPRR